MSILSRFLASFQARANEIATEFDDPKASLDYSLTRLLEIRGQMNRSLIEVAAAYKRLDDQRAFLASASERHQEQARQAINGGREDIARAALERKQEVDLRRVDLDSSQNSLQLQLQSLKASQVNLERKIAFFQSKKEELKAIYDASRAQVRVREAIAGLSQDMSDIGSTLQRAEARIREMQTRADAIEGLMAQGIFTDVLEPGRDDIDRELARINRTQAVDEELARLRNSGKPSLPDQERPSEKPKQLEAGPGTPQE